MLHYLFRLLPLNTFSGMSVILFCKHPDLACFFKVAHPFPINTFHKNNSLGNLHTNVMINASNEGICVEI